MVNLSELRKATSLAITFSDGESRTLERALGECELCDEEGNLWTETDGSAMGSVQICDAHMAELLDEDEDAVVRLSN